MNIVKTAYKTVHKTAYKTGIINSEYYIRTTHEMAALNITDYKAMKRHGYDCSDFQGLMHTEDRLFNASEEEFVKLLTDERRLANDAGITFSQVHAPWPTDDRTEESRAQRLDHMKKAVRGTVLLGSENLVVHPLMPDWGHEDEPDWVEQINEEFLRQICPYAADYGVNICLENMPMTALRLSRMNKIVEMVERLKADLPNLFICMDTGHCNLYGDDCGDMVRLCGERLKVLHIHDNSGCRDDHHFPYCGTINWESFSRALRETGFDGVLSLETAVLCRYPEGRSEKGTSDNEARKAACADARETMAQGLAKLVKTI